MFSIVKLSTYSKTKNRESWLQKKRETNCLAKAKNKAFVWQNVEKENVGKSENTNVWQKAKLKKNVLTG